MKVIADNEEQLSVKRGEIYLFRVSSKETEGTETMKTRPAVIISTNRLNKKKLRHVIIPITSKKFDRIYDFEVSVLVQDKKGKALCDQIKVFSTSRIIGKKLGNLNQEEMKEIGEKVLALLDFEELIDLYGEIYK